MKIVFISGPFRADTPWKVEQNIRKAEEYSLSIMKLAPNEVFCYCSHTNTRLFDKELPDSLLLSGNIEMLKRCDALYVLPGYETSTGTEAEIAFARQVGKPVFFHTSALFRWIGTPDAK